MATVELTGPAARNASASPLVSRRRRRRTSKTMLTVLMLILFVVWVAPIAWVALASVRTSGADAHFTFAYFSSAFSDYGLLPNLLNSITATLASTILAVLVGTPAAYALSRFRFRGNRAGMFLFLMVRMVPAILVALPIFMLSRATNTYDTISLLIAIYTVTNLSWVVFMMRSYFDEIPLALDEAAAIDGATQWRQFISVVLPLARPGLVATTIFCIITSWNEYLFAVVLTSTRASTLPASLTSFLTVHGLLIGPMAAASISVMLPIMGLALWMQRHLIRGMAMGAVK